MVKHIKKHSLPDTLLKVAWLSVLLGLGMELLLLAVAAGFKNSVSAQAIVADIVQKVSWSTIVCMGVAVGLTATKMRPGVMSILGLVAAPVAFNIAKVIHKSAAEVLSVSVPIASGGPSPLVLALIKGLEYAALGFILGKIGVDKENGVVKHVLAGCAVGLVFGGLIIYLTLTTAISPIPISGIVSRSVNELLFPVGCSLVLFTAQRLGESNIG